jgi:hypothetical protein
MAIVQSRKIIKMGASSRIVTLPAWWWKDAGKDVEKVSLVGDRILVLVPFGQEEIARRIIDSIQKEIDLIKF